MYDKKPWQFAQLGLKANEFNYFILFLGEQYFQKFKHDTLRVWSSL